MAITPLLLLTTTLALTTALWLLHATLHALTSPLRLLPGPLLSHLTNLPLKHAVTSGRRIFHIDALHARHGPIVRLSPTEVAVGADVAAFKAIHGVSSRFAKAAWYERLTNFPRPSVFTLRDRRAHAARRRLFARGFGKTYLRETWEGADVRTESTSLIFAGSGTTANTLTFLNYAVLSRPALQEALEAEVATLADGFTDADLEQLPLLNGIINETLRLYCAVPGSLPRVVPPGGVTLGGYFIPEGTTVSTQAYTLHRDEGLWENAEEFDPYRWLPGREISAGD
ncbi:putative cytochrome p450 monooxygenase protein [Neofusicoccum parvum UCRNP2]|uniref:Putative cytochrome p450 monooxygenase protein n=1 Tax=Botryosphaeria parva (strain UCR-NP2) TaxID=1287680 RepID=R1G915_BOTPV|nr:putative cytochrome p450 monooxygenase protein [Neofusicoccum parvum UCRNP2]